MIIRDDSTAFAVLKEIVDHSQKSQVGLTLEEIREKVGVSHRSIVHHHVSRLVSRGLLDRVPNKSKSIRPTVKGEKMVELMRS